MENFTIRGCRDKMNRIKIINIIGENYLTSNIENGEFSYPKAFKNMGIPFTPIKNSKGRAFKNIDIRFVNESENISILVETKSDFSINIESAKEQLSAYVSYEKILTGNKIIAILANTIDDEVMIWKGTINNNNFLTNQIAIVSMADFLKINFSNINNKEQVMKNTYHLNEILHKYGIVENLRSQFVGTCLLALKNGFDFSNPKLTNAQIRAGIKDILGILLTNNINKAEKLSLLNKRVLESQDIRNLDIGAFKQILTYIEEKILPFINDKSTAGQDLLNLFFITFNKYVGKADKNQAFTPDHITDFMSKITGVNKKTHILDPCCGSGSFLVRSMTHALDDCATIEEQENVRKKHIFGIEYDENIYGLATTNMLIHSDGNSNILNGSCFDFADWIKTAKPNIVLMNPPYNASKKYMPKKYTNSWTENKKEDPSKGLYFVDYICEVLNSINQQATLAVLLPLQCAIGNSKEIKKYKSKILKENTLDAVFTLPKDIFYPGAGVNVCCMVFKTGTEHSNPANPDTFFGFYRNDGFKKKKNLGRVEQINDNGLSIWETIETEWINLYKNRKEVIGKSTTKKVSASDEWLCEAYMETDYSTLCIDDFQRVINKYLGYRISKGEYNGNDT